MDSSIVFGNDIFFQLFVDCGGGHWLKITAFPYHHNLMHARNVSLQITANFVTLIPYHNISSRFQRQRLENEITKHWLRYR